MQTDDHAEQVRSLLAYLAHDCYSAPADIRKRAAACLDAQRRLTRPVARCTFDPASVSGYIWLGNPARPVPHPGRAHLDDLWHVLRAGATAGHLYDAASFGATPNSLRNAQERCARWLDDNGAPAAGRAMRAVGVGVDGSITYLPPCDVDLVLQHTFD